ncbi:MAG: hypothetical protein AUJ75_00925 [Candidatus Omnitrophica bacterium CG1_02_49_10]|nr:MAG: hypothetical protein AUJ75_00925 [Candidatus Omnitrophica bacterium CG1_02_49_10]
MGENVSLFVAFISGVAFFLSPCILPVIPSYLSYITGVSLSELEGAVSLKIRARALLHAVFFVFGFSTVFMLLGLSFSVAGNLLSLHIDIIRMVGGVVIIAFGVCFIFAFHPLSLLHIKTPRLKSKPAGLFGSLLVGVFFSAGWTACATPVLGSILTYAGIEANIARGAALLGAFSLGLAIPFMLSALMVGALLKFISRFSRFSRILEAVMGLILVSFGTLVLTNRLSQLSGYFIDILGK